MRGFTRISLILLVAGGLGWTVARGQSFEVVPAAPESAEAAPPAVAPVEMRPVVKTGSVREWKRTYAWSNMALSAGVAADIASSLKFSTDGQKEANALLRGSSGGFGSKGAVIEAGAIGASLLLQHYVIRRHPELRLPLAIVNFGLAGFQAWNVKHNVSY